MAIEIQVFAAHAPWVDAPLEDGDSAKVEQAYLSSGGRGRVEKLIFGQQTKGTQDEFRGYSSLLEYWRDAAAHGRRTGAGDNEAYTSLAVQLRFA